MISEYIEVYGNSTTGASVSIGNLGVEFKTNMFPYTASIVSKNEEIVKVTGKVSKENYEVNVAFSDETYVVKCYGHNNNISAIKDVISGIKESLETKSLDGFKRMLSPKFYDEQNNEIGTIEYFNQGGTSIKAYNYEKITIKGVGLFVYSIRRSRKGKSFCFYNEQNQVVGIVDKNPNTKHGKQRYTFYYDDEKWFKYIVIACIPKIINEDEIEGNTNTYDKAFTIEKDDVKFYDENFIQTIKIKVGPENLPENMELVNSLYKKSQNTVSIWIGRLFMLALLIFFGYMFARILINK